jgi:uncharacterized OB-fold protein
MSGDPLATAPVEAREFFAQCAQGVLALQRCTACERLRHYPRSHCPFCLSPGYEWQPCSGRGTVYTYTVIRQNENPRFAPRLPYIVAMVELEEGVRMLTSVVGIDPGALRVGMAVEVVFEEETDGRTVPRFRVTSG